MVVEHQNKLVTDMQNNEPRSIFYIFIQRLTHKWITDLSETCKSTKILEVKTASSCLGFRQRVLEKTAKAGFFKKIVIN